MVRQKPGTNEEDAQPQEDPSERVLKREGYPIFGGPSASAKLDSIDNSTTL